MRSTIHDQDVAKRLTTLRKMTKLNQKQFGALLGYGNQRYCGFESGRSAIPFYVISLVVQNARLCGVAATTEWLLSGLGNSPYFIEDFDEKVETLTAKTTQDPLTHFFIHALSLSKIYREKLTLFEGGNNYKPYIPAGTFIVAPKMEVDHYNPKWEGYYLYEHQERVALVKLEQTQHPFFNVTSLHFSEKKRITLTNQMLTHIYPAIGWLSNYTIALSDATDIVNLIQHQTELYSGTEATVSFETEDV